MYGKCILTIGKFPLFDYHEIAIFENNIDRRNSCRSLETNCYANGVTGIIYQFDSPNLSTNEYERHRNPVEQQKKHNSINRDLAPMFQ